MERMQNGGAKKSGLKVSGAGSGALNGASGVPVRDMDAIISNGYLPPVEAPRDDHFWLTNPPGEHGNMLCFREEHGDQVAYNGAYDWMWKEAKQNYWTYGDVAVAAIDRAVIENLLERQRRAADARLDGVVTKSVPTARMVSSVRTLLRPYVTIPASEFDSDPWLLNTLSGVIDLRSGEIVAQESGQFTYCVPCELGDPKLTYEPWLDWLTETVAYHDQEEMRDYLKQAVGYSITGSTREECMFYLHGPTRSGKGTFINTMLELLGKPLANTASFSTFTRVRDGNSFDFAPLKAARFVTASEGKKETRLNEATVKQVTGRDPIVTSFKGKDEFSYIPQYKIWLASNHRLMGDPNDDAFWIRARVLSFPNSRAGQEDKGLKDRMAQPEYLRGVLRYAVEGAYLWYNSPNGLVTPQCIRDLTQSHRDALDSVGLWLEQCTSPRPGNAVASQVLYQSYESWCEENGFSARKANGFAESMQARGYTPARPYHGGRQMRGWAGLILSDNDE